MFRNAVAHKFQQKVSTCNGSANKFNKVVLHGETLALVTTAIVAKVESSYSFGETCLATEVQKPTILHCATPAETCFVTPLHTSFSKKFQRVTAA